MCDNGWRDGRNPPGGGEPHGMNPFATASEMLRALQERKISAVELLDLHRERIDRLDPRLNAVVIRDDERARAAARAADEARARGAEGALLGLPLTVKECFYVRGLPTTGGVPERASAVADADSALVARVRAAGAVIMGKTNVPPYAADWQSSNPLFGRTVNPWDPERTPGGSSGGAAAAVAAGLSPLEFGGDLGGSIRIPAAFCGVYGHKASETALPRSGHYPGLLLPNPVLTMSAQGPLARSAEDMELALAVVAGPEEEEAIAWRLELPPARHERLQDFRIAVLPPLSWAPCDPEILAAVADLGERLRAAGATVAEAWPEGVGSLQAYHQLYVSLLGTRAALMRSEEELREDAAAYRARGDAEAVARARGLEANVAEYVRWHGRRSQHRAVFRAFFREWDVLLAPANLVPAFPHTDAPFVERTLTVDGRTVPYDLQAVYPGLANLSGHPATAFPAGLTREGLPIGLQVVGPYLEDRTPIRFAALIAAEWGGFQAPEGWGSLSPA
jgi:amidase